MVSIFSEEEAKERLAFTMFLQQYFYFRQRSTSTFRYPLDADFLYDLFFKTRPETTFSRADTNMYFAVLGAYNTNQIFIDLSIHHASDLPPHMLTALKPHMTPEAIRKLDMNNPAISTDISLNNFIRFAELFIKQTSKGVRTTTSKIYELYVLYCLTKDMLPISVKRMVELIRMQISPVKRGYADGISGKNYALCTIPAQQHWEASLSLGLGIFEYMGKLFDNRGKRLLLDDRTFAPLDGVTKLYITDRATKRSKLYESTTAQTPDEQESSHILGRETKDSFADVEGRETTAQRKAPEHPGESSISTESRNAEDRNTQARSAEIPGTTHPSTGRGNKPCGDAFGLPGLLEGNDYAGGDIAENRHDDAPDALIQGVNGTAFRDHEEGADESVDIPTKNEIFTALQIAYNINPASFTKKTMNSYLVSMNVDYSAEDLWDEFFKFIHK